METKVHKRYVKYSEGFSQWVVVEEGIFSSPRLGWRPFMCYLRERFSSEEEAARAAQERSRAQLAEAIECTRNTKDAEAKEEMFLDVMRLAWEHVGFILQADPYIRMHPREHDYRKRCGFKGGSSEN